MSIDARLEHNLSLSNLVNPESLTNLCTQLSDFHGVQLWVTDPTGALLYGNAERPRFCHGNGPGPPPDPPSTCSACTMELPCFESSRDKFATAVCASGPEYLRGKIENQFDTVGYLVMGPYSPDLTRLLETVAGRTNGEESQRRVLLELERIPSLTRPRAQQILLLLCTILEEIAFANYQSYLVSKMHLQCYSENLGELIDKDDELQKYEDTLRESKQLRSLF